MLATSKDDQVLMQATFESAADAISDVVTGALHNGLALRDVAVVVERSFDGNIVTGCTRRTDLTRRLEADAAMTDDAKRAITKSLALAAPDALPVVLLVQREGYIAVTLRHERGTFVAIS